MQRRMFLALATLALGFAAPAQACQLICQKTVAAFDGNLGGVTGADAKCVSEFGTGWKFPRSASLPTNSGGNYSSGTTLSKFLYGYSVSNNVAWLGPYNTSPTAAYSCVNWTSNSSSDAGGTVYNSAGNGTINTLTCDQKLPLICCNM